MSYPHDQPFPHEGKAAPRPPDSDEQALLASVAARVLDHRRRRDRLIRYDLFAEPAWDILLTLYVEHHRSHPASLDRLSERAGLAPAITLRWIGLLIEHQLVTPSDALAEGDRYRIALSPNGVEEMERYLRDVVRRAGSD